VDELNYREGSNRVMLIAPRYYQLFVGLILRTKAYIRTVDTERYGAEFLPNLAK